MSSTSRANRRGRSSGNKPRLSGERSARDGDPKAYRSTEASVRRAEWIGGGLITMAAVYLHLVYLVHAGGLWRDEAGVVRLATLPAFDELWSRLGHESCPLFFPVAVRMWTAIGFGDTDFGLRVYGLIVGLLFLGAVWFNGWALTRSVPLVSLGLLGANVAVVRWGDSLRAYGSGSVLIMITAALMWRFVQSPSLGRWLLAGLAAVLSVQCLFHNAFLLLAVCAAGCVICTLRREGRSAAAVLALGGLAAASLLPYARIVREAKDWSVLSQTGFIPTLIWQNLSTALSLAMPWTKWLWIGLALLGIGLGLFALARELRGASGREQQVTLYAAVALVVGIAGYFVFLKTAALPTQTWYYLPLLAFAAVCLDAASAHWHPRWQVWRLLFAVILFGVSFPGAWRLAQHRQTNMDLLAADLSQRVTGKDLILVHPWYYGISFDRYYHGEASWTTIPALEDHRFHRYDLLKNKMQMENAIQPVLDSVALTLQSSNRVWIVGGIPLDGSPPPNLNPAPNNPWGWLDEPYSQIWGMQAGFFLATHARQAARAIVPSTNGVNVFENLGVLEVSGWR